MNQEWDTLWDTAAEWSLYVSNGCCYGVFKEFDRPYATTDWRCPIDAEVIF